MKKTRKGFTIVELVIVIAVIAVLTAILVPTFIHLNNKANEAADKSLVTNLNKALAMREAEEGDKGKNMTMYDCVVDLEQEGYRLPQLATRSGEDLVWSQQANRFFLSSEYERDKEKKNYGEKYNCWHIYEQMPQTQEWAIYPNEEKWTEANVTITKVGFDAGNAAIDSITFNGGDGLTLVLRSNAGTVTINAEQDTVNHYGLSDNTIITAVDSNNSYHEFGYSSFLSAAKGHVVVESIGGVGTLYVSSSQANVDITNADNVYTVLAADEASKAKVNGAEAIIADSETVEEYKEAAKRYAGGLGTSASPYLLKEDKHLESLDADVKTSVTSGKYYKMIADYNIDNFGIIGCVIHTSKGEQSGEVESVNAFSGTLDGGNHTFSYTIVGKQSSIKTDSAGLFSSIDGGTVRNLIINANLNGSEFSDVGGLAGVLADFVVENVTVKGTITGRKEVGGFAGLAYGINSDVYFRNSSNNAKVICTYNAAADSTKDQYTLVGGFVGQGNMYSYKDDTWGGDLENEMVFENCVNNGSIELTGTTAHTISVFSNFVGFASDGFYGTFRFNNCKVGDGVSYQKQTNAYRTLTGKRVLTGSTPENVTLAPTLKYVGISSNVWSAGTPKCAIYVNDQVVTNGTADHIIIE